MNITPEQFLQSLKEGKTERELNLNEDLSIDPIRLEELIKIYEHTEESATEHLQTDYSNGFTICKDCGSYYHLGKGFTKHLSKGCLHCEGHEKHRLYRVKASGPAYGNFPARTMCVMFDDGMSYTSSGLKS